MMLATMASTPIGLPAGLRSFDELATQILRQGRPLRIKARGGSMTPFVRDGDVALVMPADGDDIRVGDLICYQTAGRLFLHRVVSRGHAQFLAKGDALASIEVVPLRRVLGKVSTLERGGRVRRLDTRFARRVNRVMACLSPALSRLMALAIAVRGLGWARLRG